MTGTGVSQEPSDCQTSPWWQSRARVKPGSLVSWLDISGVPRNIAQVGATGKGTQLKGSSQSGERPMRLLSEIFHTAVPPAAWFKLIQLPHKPELTLRTAGRLLGGETRVRSGP